MKFIKAMLFPFICSMFLVGIRNVYHAPHPTKAKSLGKPVYILPFVLFADDTSGNKSKKWHKFISWYLKFPGLPRKERLKTDNIHFLCCSDNLSALELAKPMAEELFMLETQGLEVYDAQSKQMVLVVAPLICIVADNPMSSELLNHLRGAANKYCRICEVRVCIAEHALISTSTLKG